MKTFLPKMYFSMCVSLLFPKIFKKIREKNGNFDIDVI